MDKFWINAWMFMVVVTVLSSLMMGGFLLLNNSAQNSDEASIKEKEAISGITYELWEEFKVLVPIILFVLLISAWVYIKFGKHDVSTMGNEK